MRSSMSTRTVNIAISSSATMLMSQPDRPRLNQPTGSLLRPPARLAPIAMAYEASVSTICTVRTIETT